MYSKKVINHFQKPKNAGEMKSADAVGEVGNMKCVLPEVLVYTNPSIKDIKDVKSGLKVIGKDGYYHNVSKTFRRRYHGKVYEIDTYNLGKTMVTPEHNIYGLKINKESYKWVNRGKYTPDWYEASELKRGDFILYPIPKETKNIKSIDLNIPQLKYDSKSFKIPNKISLNNDFLKLIGYYLSEGHVSLKKCNGHISFSFNSKEIDYVKDVCQIINKLFGIECKTRKVGENCIVVLVYSSRLARFFEREFGKGAANKKIPQWAMLLSFDKQKNILCGLWRGDGYIQGHVGKYVTISKQLAYQVRMLLLRQKIIFSFLTVKEKGIHKQNYCVYIRDRDALRKLANITKEYVKIEERKKWPKRSWFDEDFYYARIKEIKTFEYFGNVYNLEVDDSHSFVSESCLLHNCGDAIRVYLKVKNDVIKKISFQTYGCVAAIACSDVLCDLVKGKTLDNALKVEFKDIIKNLGDLPPVKYHCSVLGIQALREAIESYKKKKK